MKTLFAAPLALLSFSQVSLADCQIKNDTSVDFSVTAGNVSNRSFTTYYI